MRYTQWLFWGVKLGGELFFVGSSCAAGQRGFINASTSGRWKLRLPPGALQGFLQPSPYFPTLKCLSSGPAQSLCSLSSEFFFLFPFSLPALPQLAFFRYVVTVPLTHPCPMLLSQLFWRPRSFPLGPTPSLSLSFLLVWDHLHPLSLALVAVSLRLWPFPILLHPSMSHAVLLPVISPFPIDLFQVA